MRTKRLISFLVVIAVTAGCGTARVNAAGMDTSQRIFAPSFSALQVEVDGAPLVPPVIYLNTNDRITIKFDERADDMRYMRYEIISCDSDWRPSQLIESEYIDGFNDGHVTDYELSSLTPTNYVHYVIRVPNDEIRIIRPGNYLLRVFDEDDRDTTLLQARFYVVSQEVGIGAEVTSRTDIDTNNAHQQLIVNVNTDKVKGVENYFNEFKLVAIQNGRTDNSVTLSRPSRIDGHTLVYDHARPLIFPAGNEYRRFETVADKYPGMGVDHIVWEDPYPHYVLYADGSRRYDPYLYDQTQFGRYVVRNDAALDSDSQAKYTIVHFTLKEPQQIDGDYYIEGDLTDRRFSPDNRMMFNPDTQAYEAALLLKQGSYNYQYLFVPTGTQKGLTQTVEGDKYDTVNQYTILVYHRGPMDRADSLIGAATVTSGL